MEWLNKIPNWLKIPLKILLPALCIFSGFLLLINDNLAEQLYLKEFREMHGFAVGIIFLVSLSLIICYVILFILDICKRFIRRKKIIKKFKNLDETYKSALYTMYRSQTHSLKMDLSNGLTSYLLAINAIGHGGIPEQGTVFDFYIQPWVVWGIESEIKESNDYIKYFEKNKNKLKNKKDFNIYENVYQSTLKFLKDINTKIDIDDDDID